MWKIISLISGLLILGCLSILQIKRYRCLFVARSESKTISKSEIALLIAGAVIYRFMEISMLKLIVIFYSITYMPIFIAYNILKFKKYKNTADIFGSIFVLIVTMFLIVYTLFLN